MARQERRFLGLWGYGLGTPAMMTAALLVTVFWLATQVRPDPWYDPRFAIPIFGIILGNTMTGVALGMHILTNGAVRDRASIEAQLALGDARYGANGDDPDSQFDVGFRPDGLTWHDSRSDPLRR